MNRIRRIPKWIVENKWKTIFGTGLSGYLANWKYGDYLHSLELDAAVKLALERGNLPAMGNKIEKAVVILNPVANGGFATQAFNDFSRPILDCAGYNMEVKKTEYVKHERDIVKEIDPSTDILIIAAGDTTVQNVLTGLNRRPDSGQFKNLKIGVIPLGKTNKVWRNFASGRSDSWSEPYGRAVRITEATRAIVNGVTKKANGLSLTTDDGITIYTMSGLRWGLYYDIEKRAEDYTLPPWWKKGKLMRSYFHSYLNGDFEKPRTINLKYAPPVTAEQAQKQRTEKAEKEERFKQLASKYRGTSSFGFGRRRVQEPKPISVEKDDPAIEKQLEKRLDLVEIDFDLNHSVNGHMVDIKSETRFWSNDEKTDWGTWLLSFQKMLNRKQDYGEFEEINTTSMSVSDFEIEPEISSFDEDQRENTFYLDGESFIPCKLKAKLMPEHYNIFYHQK